MRLNHRAIRIIPISALLLAAAWNFAVSEEPTRLPLDYSPVDLVLTSDESRAVTANQTANSIALVDLANGKILSEAPCGDRPTNVAITPDGRRILATAAYSGEVVAFDLT